MIVAALALLLAAGPVEDFPDLVGPAAQGKLQCFMPNRERRTCLSLAGYQPDGKGGFLSTAEILVEPDPLLTMRMTAPVVIREGTICGPLREESYEKAEFLSAGKPFESKRKYEILAALLEASASMFGREICTRYTVSGDHLVAETMLDPTDANRVTMDVIWVSPEEGYRVAA
jgi:hypothetical protein